MVILKHSETYLTAYAHARAIVVKENEIVRQGQKIAEIGNSGADRVKLHFEIRKDGAPVNPEPYLSGELR
jgi:lipoprotein NlpD